MTSLETRDFVATPADIESLTRSLITAAFQDLQSRTTYLKALVATSQAELGLPVRQRAARIALELTAEDTKAQLAAVESVHARFYDAVIAAIKAAPVDIAVPARQRKKLMHNKANFARTAKSTLRAWLRSDHDLRTLTAARVTKTSLARELPARRPLTANALKRRTLGLADRLLEIVGEAAKTDRDGAVGSLGAVMSLLAQQMAEFGGSMTTKPDIAIRDGRPFKRGSAVFWPTAAANAPPEETTTRRSGAH